MERIRKALEQAERERAQQGEGAPAGAGAGNPVDLSTGLRYTYTRTVEVPQRVLLDNRLIARLIAVSVLPQPLAGPVTASEVQWFSRRVCSTRVRSMR